MTDRKALIERKKILQSQPLTKWISVIETDGLNTQKKKHLVRLYKRKKYNESSTDCILFDPKHSQHSTVARSGIRAWSGEPEAGNPRCGSWSRKLGAKTGAEGQLISVYCGFAQAELSTYRYTDGQTLRLPLRFPVPHSGLPTLVVPL